MLDLSAEERLRVGCTRCGEQTDVALDRAGVDLARDLVARHSGCFG